MGKFQIPIDYDDYDIDESFDRFEVTSKYEDKKIFEATTEIYENYLAEYNLDIDNGPDYYADIISKNVVTDLIYDGYDSQEIMEYIYDVSYDFIYNEIAINMEAGLE